MSNYATRAATAASSLSWQTTFIVLVALGGSIFLTWADKINGDAFVGVVGAVLGGILVGRGVTAGSAATTAPPPPEA